MFSNALERCICVAPLLLLAGGTLLASDTVLINGHIFTGNPQSHWAEAIAVTGDKIEAVGSNAEIARHRSANTKVIDLKGKTVIPGITDGHVHLWFGALALHGFNLSTPESNITPKDPDLLLSRIKDYAASHPKDPVIFGRVQFITDFSPSGNAYKKPTVTHELLDRAVPDRPRRDPRHERARLVGEPEDFGSRAHFGCSVFGSLHREKYSA